MSYFRRQLAHALNEMAMLKGWNPTKRQLFYIQLDGRDLDPIKATSRETAIAQYIAFDTEFENKTLDELGLFGTPSESLETIASRTGYTIPELKTALTARPATRNEVVDFESFGSADVNLINQDRVRQQIATWLNNNQTPYKWEIYFDTEPHMVVAEPGVIVFHKKGNVGGDPLKPGMILHTIGHAVGEFCDHEFHDLTREVLYMLRDISGEYLEWWPHGDPRRSAIPNIKEAAPYLLKLLHTKPAAATLATPKTTWKPDGQSYPGYGTWQEIFFDLIGIYVKNGRIKIAPNQFHDYQITAEQCWQLRSYIEGICKVMLDKCVGEIITD